MKLTPEWQRTCWEFATYNLRNAMRDRLLALRDGDARRAERQAQIIENCREQVKRHEPKP